MFANAKLGQKQTSKDSVQKKDSEKEATVPNHTGIPDAMKTRFENLSGFSFDDVQVHYNSQKPAQLQALAYTQGNQVYVAPGQEKHLGHELGHVAQQKAGRVRPTTQYNSVHINDNIELEREADNIGFSTTAAHDIGNNTLQMKSMATLTRKTQQGAVVQLNGFIGKLWKGVKEWTASLFKSTIWNALAGIGSLYLLVNGGTVSTENLIGLLIFEIGSLTALVNFFRHFSTLPEAESPGAKMTELAASVSSGVTTLFMGRAVMGGHATESLVFGIITETLSLIAAVSAIVGLLKKEKLTTEDKTKIAKYVADVVAVVPGLVGYFISFFPPASAAWPFAFELGIRGLRLLGSMLTTFLFKCLKIGQDRPGGETQDELVVANEVIIPENAQ